MTYQPTAIAPGERSCVDRWQIIDGALPAGPFTLLDFGANAGWFTRRAVADHQCTATAVDDHPDLPSISDQGITVMHQRMTARDLRSLPRHDVVLALSVLHHMPDWREALHEIAACRHTAIVETPHPDETWMRHAAARHELGELHDAVLAVGEQVGESQRIGRDGTSHMRPIVVIGGRVRRYTGTVFSGSGSNSRRMHQFSTGLDAELGYVPFRGSLNLRTDGPVGLGRPWLDWLGRNGTRTRDYQFWRAWIGDLPCHAMTPGRRGHGPECLEVVAPVGLRDHLGLTDGDTVTLDVETSP